MSRTLSAADIAKRDERKAKFQLLAKQITALTDDQRAELAQQITVTTIEGRKLSVHNCCMIYYQKADATIVGGFRQWIDNKRYVRKGERGLMIWVPVVKKAEAGKPDEKFFICGTVFDVSQTDPIDQSSPESKTVIIIDESIPHNNQPTNVPINNALIKSSPSLSLRNQAGKLTEKIEHLRRPMAQNPTPKRMREFKSRLHDADNMERTQKAMIVLADLHDNGTIPEELANLSRKSEIGPLVYKGTLGGGYYEVIPNSDYRDTSPTGKALQQLIGSVKSGFETHKTTFIENDLRGIPGFFPTPKELARKMVDEGGIIAGQSVLEPSAGSGRLIDAILGRFTGADCGKITAIERNCELANLLRDKKDKTLYSNDSNYRVMQFNFLEVTIEQIGKFDRIIMNPPFENGADIKHIKHAINFLKPGGKLVAICANCSRQREQLMPLAYSWEDLSPDTFKSSGTSVNTAMIIING